MKFSIISVLGILLSLAMLVTGIFSITGHIQFYDIFPMLSNYKYLNFPSLFIVLGGVLNSIFIMYPGVFVGKAIGSFFLLFVQTRHIGKSLHRDIEKVVSWSERVVENKRKASEEIQEEEKKEVAGYLFSLMNTNYTNEQIRLFSQNNIEEDYSRKLMTVDTLTSMGSAAPAFGMFGTLFGLIVMLGSLDNPAEMGPGLAAALITTLYGIAMAHLIFFPLSRKLRNLAKIERKRDYIILEGVLMINEKQSPFYIEDKLYSFLRRADSLNNGNDDAKTSKSS